MADMNKQVNGMTPFVLGIVIIALTLVIGIFIVSTLDTTFQQDLSLSQINESFNGVAQGAWANSTGYTLQRVNASTTSFVITQVFNQSSLTIVPANNYSVTAAGVLFNTTSVAPFNLEWNNVTISYTYAYNNAPTSSSAAAADVVTGLSGGTAWITILIVVGFAVIVLGFLGEGLGAAAKGQGTSPVY